MRFSLAMTDVRARAATASALVLVSLSGCGGTAPTMGHPLVGSDTRAEASLRRPPPPVTQADAGRMLAWFRSLGFPSVAGKRYVEVRTGADVQNGFLMQSYADHYSVVYELAPVRIEIPKPPKHSTDEEDGEEAEGEEIDLEAEMEAPPEIKVLSLPAELRATLGALDAAPGGAAGSRTQRLALFYLARGAYENGFRDEACRLFGHVAGPDSTRDLLGAVQRELGHKLYAEAIDAYAIAPAGWFQAEEPRAPDGLRTELRQRLQWIADRFPAQSIPPEVTRYLELLDRTDRQDAGPSQEAAGTPADFIDRLTAELAQLLGDDCMSEYTMTQWHGRDTSGRILALGYNAVPMLLSLVDDPRPTRCRYWDPQPDIAAIESSDAYPRLASYGQIALDLLNRLAGEEIASRAEALAWWQAMEQRGGVERNRTSRGSEVVAHAKARIAKDRTGGLREAIALTRRARGWLRVALVELLAGTDGTEQLELLTSELQSGRILSAKLHAARGLRRRGSKAWIEPARAALERAVEQYGPSGCDRYCDDPFVFSQLANLLVESGDVPALQAVQALWPRAGVHERMWILHAVAAIAADGSRRAAIANDILVAALSDDTVAEGTRMTTFGVTCHSPRVSDIAAIHLARRLGASFDCKLAEDARAARIEALRRSAQGRSQRPR